MLLYRYLWLVCVSVWADAFQIPLETATKWKAPNVIQLHKDLITFPSVSGDENAVTLWMAKYLRAYGLTAELQTIEKGRQNLYAYAGKQRQTTVLLTSHLDTVPPFFDYEHFKNGTIAGRGTVDDKGSVATQTVAFLEMLHSKEIKQGDVGLLFVAGEETGGDGMVKANELKLTPKTAIFGEPTAAKLCAGHKGALIFRLHAHGKAAHSSMPELGINANSILISALYELDRMSLPFSDKFGNSTLNIGKMEGGVAANVIPASANADVIIRVAAGTVQEMRQLVVDKIKSVDERIEIEWLNNGYDPTDIDTDVEGFETIVVNYGTDIPNLHLDSTVKRYLYGPGNIVQAHSATERLEEGDLYLAIQDYKRLVRHALS